jgi:hypothetical protein
VVFLVIPGTFEFGTGWEIIKVLGTAVVGGYGGRSVVDRFLAEVLKQQEKRIEDVESKITASEKRAQADAKALALLNRQLERAPEAPEVSEEELKTAIQAASASVKVQAFMQARTVRRQSWESDKALMEKTIPVFEALAESDARDEFHRNHGQLGYALKDQRTPDWERAEAELGRAIGIRDRVGHRGFRLYEFNRAICRIRLDDAFRRGEQSPPDVKDAILTDLRGAAQDSFVAGRVRATTDPIGRWLQLNSNSVVGSSVRETAARPPSADRPLAEGG